MHPGHGAVRLARTSVFAATALALSIGAHQLAGGCLPSLGAILVAAGPVGLGAALLTTRRCRFGVLVVALGALQAGLHVFFHLTGSPATASTRPMAAHPGAFTSGATHHGLHLVCLRWRPADRSRRSLLQTLGSLPSCSRHTSWQPSSASS